MPGKSTLDRELFEQPSQHGTSCPEPLLQPNPFLVEGTGEVMVEVDGAGKVYGLVKVAFESESTLKSVVVEAVEADAAGESEFAIDLEGEGEDGVEVVDAMEGDGEGAVYGEDEVDVTAKVVVGGEGAGKVGGEGTSALNGVIKLQAKAPADSIAR